MGNQVGIEGDGDQLPVIAGLNRVAGVGGIVQRPRERASGIDIVCQADRGTHRAGSQQERRVGEHGEEEEEKPQSTAPASIPLVDRHSAHCHEHVVLLLGHGGTHSAHQRLNLILCPGERVDHFGVELDARHLANLGRGKAETEA